MKYFVFENENSNEFARLERYEFPSELDVTLARSGKPIESFRGKLWNDDSEGTLSDILRGPVHLFIVSNQVKEILEKFDKENLQFFPVDIFDSTGDTPIAQFWYVQVLNNPSAIDWHKSSFQVKSRGEDGKLFQWDETAIPDPVPGIVLVRGMGVLVLNSEDLNGRNVFRLQDYRKAIICSETVANALKEAGLEGVSLIPTEKTGELSWKESRWRLSKDM